MSDTPRIRRVMVAVLAALFLAQLGAGVYDLLFSNYLSDVLHLDAGQRGLMELPRELPGVLSLFVMGALFFLNEVRLVDPEKWNVLADKTIAEIRKLNKKRKF